MKVGNNFADSIYPGKKCARENQLKNWELIEQCANNTEGTKLLQKNGELTNTLNPSLTSVPTITFKHVSIKRNYLTCGFYYIFIFVAI